MATPTTRTASTPQPPVSERPEVRELARLFEQKPLTLPLYYAAGGSWNALHRTRRSPTAATAGGSSLQGRSACPNQR